MPEDKKDEKDIELTYEASGVNLGAQDESNLRVKGLTKSDIGEGMFGGAVDVSAIKTMERPVLLVAVESGNTFYEGGMSLEELGKRLAEETHSKLSAAGGNPLGILDYIGSDVLKPEETEAFVTGLKEGFGGRVLGGETAEMGVVYREGQKDIFVTAIALANMPSSKTTALAMDVNFVDLSGFKNYNAPILVASTDGTGTKPRIGVLAGKTDNLHADIVNHCTDDIIVHGTMPLAFFSYIAGQSLDTATKMQLLASGRKAAESSGMYFIAGKIHSLPDVYKEAMIDIAGTIVGIVEKDKVINGSSIQEGDAVVRLYTNGIMTNGYSLAQRVFFDKLKHGLADEIPEFGRTVADELLEPHVNYWPVVRELIGKHEIRGLAHITGGGIEGNLQRIIPEGLCAAVDRKTLQPVPPVFQYMMGAGVAEEEMYRVFNMGAGMIAVVPGEQAKEMVGYLQQNHHKKDCIIGEIIQGEKRFEWA